MIVALPLPGSPGEEEEFGEVVIRVGVISGICGNGWGGWEAVTGSRGCCF